jgi:Flp pilus assembly protein TadD
VRVQLLLQCIQDFPEDGRAYCQLAKLMERRGDLDGAREMYETAEAVVRGNNAYVWQVGACFR